MSYGLLFMVLFSYVVIPVTLCSAQDQKGHAASEQEKAAIEDIIPWTVGNMRGHKMLYDEGWFVVSSSRKAFAYAKEKSLQESRTALQEAQEKASKEFKEYGTNVKNDVQESASTVRKIVVSGTEESGRIFSITDKIGRVELDFAKESFAKAMDSFVRGNLSIAKRTEEERKELASLPGDYFKALRHDFSNIHDLTEAARKRFSKNIDPQWETAFRKASTEFQKEYEESGKKQNSLAALGPVLYGYLKSFYYGLAAPASKTIVKTTVAGTTYAVFLPVAATSVVTGRTVQSVGLTVYYAGKGGVKIISPTIEGGLLSGLSLLSVGAVPVTYVAGGSMGAVNQVAFTAAAPAAGVVEATVKTAAHTAKYVGFLTYDAATGVTKVVINQVSSGIVLGYNALTAIPAHALMGACDAVFLAWDGPRLVIATARGRVKYGTDADKDSFSLGELSVGTVVDLNKLKEQEGVKVDILSEDPAVIKNVLEKIPDDVRVHDEKSK